MATATGSLRHERRGEKPAGSRLSFFDLTMPLIDGWALRRELHADPNLAHLPVVLLSAAQNVGLVQFDGAIR